MDLTSFQGRKIIGPPFLPLLVGVVLETLGLLPFRRIKIGELRFQGWEEGNLVFGPGRGGPGGSGRPGLISSNHLKF